MENAARINEDKRPEGEMTPPARTLPQIALAADLPSGPLSIADMAELFGVTHRTLHFYEEKGLISARRIGSMRTYGHDDVMRMAIVSACREGGMSIAAIQEMLAAMEASATPEEADTIFRNALLSCKRELTAGISTIRRQMQQIENLLNRVVPDYADEDAACPALSEQERQCLQMMAQGASPERIATTLSTTPLEAYALEKSILTRFGAANRSQAVTKALIAGMITE